MSNNLELFNVDVDGTVVLQKGVWQDPKQIWNFNRQSDGSYIIKNAYTGKYLDVRNSNDWDGGVIQTWGYNGSSAQRFFLSGTIEKCILRPACSSIRVVSVDGGVNLAGKKLNMWEYWGVDTQFFWVWKVKEAKESSLSYTLNKNNVKFNWTKGENADKYNIIIKSGTSGNVKDYKKIEDISETSYEIDLPAGYYEVTIEGWNYFSNACSNVVKFTISENKTDLPFDDVKPTNWYYNYVKYVYNNKIMTGYNTTTFAPNNKVTRGMVVSILYKMEGSPKVSGDSKFTDVKSTEYYAKAIKWATDKGIVKGYTGINKFKPNDNIKRQDFVIILRNYAKYKNKNVNVTASLLKYKDYKIIDSYANASMQWAVGTGVITGNSDGTLNPQGTATRAEAAAIIQKYCNKVGK